MPRETTKKVCKHHGLTDYVKEGKGRYRCKKCIALHVADCRRNRKKKLVETFGGACELCGYNKCVRSLHFHHIDPATKSFGVAEGGTCRSWVQSISEANKCALICSNCHGEVEEGLTEIPDDLIERARKHCEVA